jgi:choline dehydrogenase
VSPEVQEARYAMSARDLHPVAAALIDAGRSYGMPVLDDVHIPEPEGVGPMNLNLRSGARRSPRRAYLWPVMSAKHLTVLTEAQAVQMTLSGTRCSGLDSCLTASRIPSSHRES